MNVKAMPLTKTMKNANTIFTATTLLLMVVFLFSRNENRLKLYAEFNAQYSASRDSEYAGANSYGSKEDQIESLYANPLLDEPIQPSEPVLTSGSDPHAHREKNSANREKVDSRERSIGSINELMQHIKNDSLHTLDFDYLVDFINESEDAFQVLVSEFKYSDNEMRKSLLLQLIDNVSRKEKTDFAFTLVQSDNEMERLKALRWLSHAPNQYDSNIVTVFADALDAQKNDAVILDVMDLFVIPTEEDNPTVRERVIGRLGELTDHHDPLVAEKALTRLVNESQSHATEELIISKLSSKEENIQLAAINALAKFTEPNEEALDKLNDIMSNPYASQQVRASAVKASVSIENQLNIRDLY